VLAAFEQDRRELAQALAAPVLVAPERASEANPSQAPRVERTPTASNIPEPRSLFVQATHAPPKRSQRLLAAVLVVAAGGAIAFAAYLHQRDRMSPGAMAPATPSASPADARDIEPDAPAALATTQASATRPEPEDREVPIESPGAGDNDKAPVAATAAICPPPVEAMALCELLVQPDEPR
jgi:hypothetical protein